MKKAAIICMVVLLALSLALFACEKKDDADQSGTSGQGTSSNATPHGTRNPVQPQNPNDEYPSDFVVDRKYFNTSEDGMSIVFNQNGTFVMEQTYGSSEGIYTVDGNTVTIRFGDDPYGEHDSWFAITGYGKLEDMHGYIYDISAIPAYNGDGGGVIYDGDTSGINWAGLYANKTNGFVVEIVNVGANDFYFDIFQLADSGDVDFLYGLSSMSEASGSGIDYSIFASGWAKIESDNPYQAVFEGMNAYYGFFLYEDSYFVDIQAGESTEWAHLRGKYDLIGG